MRRAWAILAIPAALAMASGELKAQAPVAQAPVGIAPSLTASGAAGLPPGAAPLPPWAGPGGFGPATGLPPGPGGPGAFQAGDPAPVGTSAPPPASGPKIAAGPGKPICEDGFTLRPGYGSAFDNCGTCYNPDESRRWISVGAMILRPAFNSNPAFTKSTLPNGANPGDTDFSWAARTGPWVSAGIQLDNGWGLRAQWWDVVGDSGTATGINDSPNLQVRTATPLGLNWFSPAPYQFFSKLPTTDLNGALLPAFPFRNGVAAGLPDTFRFVSNLNLQALDLDATRWVEIGPIRGSVNLGLRYSYIAQHYTAERVGTPGTVRLGNYDPLTGTTQDASLKVNQDTSFLDSGHSYWGLGPTVSTDLFLPIGDYVQLYTAARAGALFGENKASSSLTFQQSIHIFEAESTNTLDRAVSGSQFSRINEFRVVPVGEVETGVEVHMGGQLMPFFRVAFVAQYWIGAGNASDSTGDLSLLGLMATGGIQW